MTERYTLIGTIRQNSQLGESLESLITDEFKVPEGALSSPNQILSGARKHIRSFAIVSRPLELESVQEKEVVDQQKLGQYTQKLLQTARNFRVLKMSEYLISPDSLSITLGIGFGHDDTGRLGEDPFGGYDDPTDGIMNFSRNIKRKYLVGANPPDEYKNPAGMARSRSRQDALIEAAMIKVKAAIPTDEAVFDRPILKKVPTPPLLVAAKQ